MKERQILFSEPMVKAILEGRKTQTRRVIKPQPHPYPFYNDGWKADKYNGGPEWAFWNGNKMSEPRTWKCPYGQPGNRLWVREKFRHYGNTRKGNGPVTANISYAADDSNLVRGEWPDFKTAPKELWWNTGKHPWRPSIHMPRWASRINLEITAILVERLQDISVEDALSEGIGHGRVSPVLEFMELWDSIGAARGYSWDSNPWVWVIYFKVA